MCESRAFVQWHSRRQHTGHDAEGSSLVAEDCGMSSSSRGFSTDEKAIKVHRERHEERERFERPTRTMPTNSRPVYSTEKSENKFAPTRVPKESPVVTRAIAVVDQWFPDRGSGFAFCIDLDDILFFHARYFQFEEHLLSIGTTIQCDVEEPDPNRVTR